MVLLNVTLLKETGVIPASVSLCPILGGLQIVPIAMEYIQNYIIVLLSAA